MPLYTDIRSLEQKLQRVKRKETTRNKVEAEDRVRTWGGRGSGVKSVHRTGETEVDVIRSGAAAARTQDGLRARKSISAMKYSRNDWPCLLRLYFA